MRTSHGIVLASILLGVAVGLVDGLIDYLFFYEGTLIGLLFSDVPGQELYIRSVVLLSFVGFGLVVARLTAQREHAQRSLRESETRFRQLAENIREVFWLTRWPDLDVIYVSPGFESIWGRPQQSLYDGPLSWIDTIHPEDRERVAEALHTRTSRGEYDEEYRIVRPDGTERWIRDRGFPILDQKGEVYRIAGIAEDITDRRHSLQALRASERKFRELFDTSTDGILHTDMEGRILEANRALLDMVGYTLDELRSMNFRDLTPPHWHEWENNVIVAQVIRDGYVGEYQKEYIRKDGTVFPVAVRGWLVRDNDGQPVGMWGRIEDITERRRLEEERRRSEAQMQHTQKLEGLGVLAGGIAHDFNNLLTAIVGHAGLALLSLPPGSPARDSVEQIQRAGQRAAELTSQLLAYSGKGRFVVRPIDLSHTVEEMGQLLSVSISKKATLRYDLDSNLPPIEADAGQLRQVILNLITNASEAIGEQTGMITIRTGLADVDAAYLNTTYLAGELKSGPYVFMEVSDDGCGMDEQTRGRIFDPFFTTKSTGRGLGLAAVVGIIRGHGGAIKVYSEPGRGTTFKVLFPAAIDAEISRQDESGAEEPALTGKVLLIDDDPRVLEVSQRMLQHFGFEVLTASNGTQGLEVFREHADEILVTVLDMSMPDMNGDEVFRAMRSLRHDAKVILTSGYNEQDATNRFAGKGLAGFVQKPFGPRDLLEKLKEAIGSS